MGVLRIKKIITVSIILLFLGIAVAPSINFNTVKASQDDDTVEVTTQACGIKGFKDTTVKLTKDQYQNLEEYLVEFRARLNQTSTIEEAIPIFKNAVVELNTYGLLPKGTNVQKMQRLVTGIYHNTRIISLLKDRELKPMDENENRFCLIYGSTNQTYFTGPVGIINNLLGWIFLLSDHWFSEQGYDGFAGILEWFGILLLWNGLLFAALLGTVNPFPLFSIVGLGYRNFLPPNQFFPASGWIHTNGVNGEKLWNGSLRGGLSGLFDFLFPFSPAGISGFTGIKLTTRNNIYYFGFALNVKIFAVT